MTNPIRWFLSRWLLWVFEADREPEPWQQYVYGDVIHVPEKAKRRAAE